MTNDTISPELAKAMEEGHRVYVDGLREQLGIPADWTYYRTPYSTEDAMQQFFDIVGKDNYFVSSGVSRHFGTSLSMYVSPEGMKRIDQYVKDSKP